jgi:tetratricopeptide (TPR) repeat protein
MQPMARIGRLSRVGVLVLTVMLAVCGAEPAADPQSAVATTLAIQDAMRQGRDHLQNGRAKEAVDALESQLARINGNASYLALLREAYAAYLKELQLAHQDEPCAVYLKRLQILDKSASDRAPPRPAKLTESRADAGTHAVRPDDDPLQQAPRREAPAAGHQPTMSPLLPDAEKAFAEKRYREADALFSRAYGTEAADPQHASQWAYCKLYTVVARLKEAEAAQAPIAAAEMEREVTAALRMAASDAKLDTFGRQVLDAVRQRAGAAPAGVTIRHTDRGGDGWAKAETANFRLFHNQPRDFAERLLRAAEQARSGALEKWSAGGRGDWKPACEVFVYATAAEYAKATGKPADSPGHATYQVQNGAVIGRRLDLRADEPNLLAGVVPHETTHLVLGDLFADAPLPRWADEGMAVLAEPRSRIDRFGRTLHSSRRQGRLVPLDKLFAKDDYPDAALITVFYVESVSVVDFLVGEKGPQEFVQFLRDAAKGGLEAALEKHYGYRGVAGLQERWLSKTFAAADGGVSSGAGAQ